MLNDWNETEIFTAKARRAARLETRREKRRQPRRSRR